MWRVTVMGRQLACRVTVSGYLKGMTRFGLFRLSKDQQGKRQALLREPPKGLRFWRTVLAHYKSLKVKMLFNYILHPVLTFLVLLTGRLSSIINLWLQKVLKKRQKMKLLTIVDEAQLCLELHWQELIGAGVHTARTGDHNRCCKGNVQGRAVVIALQRAQKS